MPLKIILASAAAGKTNYCICLAQQTAISRYQKVVDFKTDRLRNRMVMEKQNNLQGYREQIQSYGRAFQKLIKVKPVLQLCFLYVAGSVQLLSVLQV